MSTYCSAANPENSKGMFWPKGLSGKMCYEHDLGADRYIPHKKRASHNLHYETS